jgi:tetratricopeptide (TPR) repeat protein
MTKAATMKRKFASRWLFAASAASVLFAGLSDTVSAQQPAPQPAGAPAGAGAAGAAAPKPATATGATGGVTAGGGVTAAPPSTSAGGTTAGAGGTMTGAAAGADAGAAFGSTGTGTTPSTSGSSSSSASTPILLATPKQVSPPPPPPTAAQLAAYQTLKAETDAYEKGARDYRDTVTTIIRLHYEAKKKEILSGLDSEISIEKAELKKARETAIKRLEEFIATYSGTRADPVATPDAMYRLAALYEERARSEDATEDMSVGLKPAIALYKRIINEYPAYKHTAAIYYFLAHAYDDAGRTEESQQVYRSSVCHNHYKYPTPPNPKNPEQDTITPLPQDNTEEYWGAWRANHRDASTLRKGGVDTYYTDPYPADCQPLPQPDLIPGEEPAYLAETWWQIGEWEFNQLDFGGGVVKDEPAAVWDYDRAASAYQQSLKYKRMPVYQVALYKYAWTLFKQQRYEAATKEFVHLLLFTDEWTAKTGENGLDFQNESFQYVAASLTNVDFAGPGANEPFIQRPDIVDVEPDPVKAEMKLHVAIDRVRDPNLIPQDKPWTISIYKALAEEFRNLNEFNNAIEIYIDMLKKWPMHPTAPETQNAIAETYDQQNVTKKVGTKEHDEIAAKALEARTALANYIGNTPWVDANKDNPEALATAERLVKGGLQAAAATHTNQGFAALSEANNTSDPARQTELLERAQAEYKLAALGWAGYLHQDENASDAYQSRYWLADARYRQVRVEVLLNTLKKGPPPSSQEIAEAKAAAVAVRDSNEDDKYLMNAAVFVVDLADVDRDVAYHQFDDTNGAAGIEKRQAPRFDTPDGKWAQGSHVIADPIPPQIIGSMQARAEFIDRVPPQLDVSNGALAYKVYIADEYFVYGHFDEASKAYQPIYDEHCGKDASGYVAWERLITMSNQTGNVDRSRQLAEAEAGPKVCALTPDQKARADLIVNPTLQEAAYAKARDKFKEAQGMQPGPERDKAWREAAGLFEAALQAAPGRDEAPEGAMNAAYAYKQVGDFSKAIDMYNKFITEYGSEDKLNGLQKGDAKAKVAADPKKYQERLKYLGDAYDALATTYFSFFNYQRAAETQEKISGNTRFDEKTRKQSAQTAMDLYNALGQREKMLAQYKLLTSLHPTADEQSKADYAVADYDFKQWSPQGGDAGQNRQARLAAEQSLMAFYQKNRSKPAAAKYSLEAAYQIAKMKQKVGDPQYHTWFKSTINAWEFLDKGNAQTKDGKGKESQTSPSPDYAAEAEFTLLDEEIHTKYDYDTNHHHFAGSIEDVLGKFDPKTHKTISKGKYQKDAEDADKYDKQLEHIARTYQSVDWVPAAIARQGALYDDLRTGLYNTVPPQLKYFTAQQDALLKRLENSGRDDLAAQADDLRSSVKEGWRSKKEMELDAMDTLMVRRYATAVTLARAYNVRNAAVARAINRLAYFTDIIGDTKMQAYVTGTANPTNKSVNLTYTPGQFVQSRPGIAATPPPDAKPEPLPVAP